MAIRFIYGRAGSGKSTKILDMLKEEITSIRKTPVIVLVPDQYTFDMEKRVSEIFLSDVKDKYLRTRVLGFNNLGNIIFSQVGGLTDVNINSSGKSIITYKAVEKVSDELKVFSKSMTKPGFIESISDIIMEMKQHNIDPQNIIETSETIDNEILSMKLEDIGKIYKSYEENLHEKYVDSQDILDSLASKIAESNFLDDSIIYIDEFEGFSPKQYKIITEILKKSREVNIAMTMDELNSYNLSDLDIFRKTKVTVERLRKIAKEEDIDELPPIALASDHLKRFKGNLELDHLEKNYSFYPYKKYMDDTKKIEIKEFNNYYHEIEEIAKEIVEITRSEKARFRDITIATRDLNRYGFLVESIFDEYEIPHFLDQKREAKSNPIIGLIISLLEMKTRGYKYDVMFRYLKSGLIGIANDDLSLIENYVLANGIKGRKWFEGNWDYRVNRNYRNAESEHDLEIKLRINEIKDNIMEPIINFQNKIKGRNKVEEICRYIYEFLIDINLPETIDKLCQEFKAKGDLERASQYSQIWNMVIDMLDQMVELLEGEQISLDRFTKVLNLGFEENELGIVPPSLDQVLVSSVDRMKNTETKYLYLVGTLDGVFPKIIKDESILNDKDRSLIEEKGLQIDVGSKTKSFEEQFLVYKALTSTSENLIVSYPISNHEGKTLRPSSIISRLKKIFPNIKNTSYLLDKFEDREEDESILKSITSKKPTFNEMINALKNYDVDESKGKVLNDIWLDVYKYFLKDENYKSITENIVDGLRFTNKLAKIEDKKIKELYAGGTLSVSRLEKYSECPFSYFVQYGLKAEERMEYDFTPPDLGTFVHNILEIFSKELKKDRLGWRDIDESYIDGKVSNIVDDMIEFIPGYILNSSSRYKYLAYRLKKLVTSSVEVVAFHIKSGSFEPSDYEVQFGKDSKYPPIKIVLEDGEEISLVGQIDRIDEFDKGDEKYIRIVDYKSGSKTMSLVDVYHGLQLQLMVYLDAILESNIRGNANLKPAAIMYFKVDDPIASFAEDKSDDAIKEAILKEVRMKGLVIKDLDIIKEMDMNLDIENNKNSMVIPVSLKKDGNLGKSTALIEYDEFDVIRKHVKHSILSICEEMMSGNIDITPYKNGDRTPCGFCKFSAICQFDTTLKDNKYKVITKKSNDEVIMMMKGEIEDELS